MHPAALGHLDQQQLDEVERQQSLEQAGLHPLRAGAAAAGHERGEDALHRAVGGDVTGDPDGCEHRAAATQLALERQHPPGASDHGGLVAGHLGQRSGGTPAGDRAVDQARRECGRSSEVDTPPDGTRRRPADDEHVRGADQIVQHGAAAGGVQVGDDAALATQPQRCAGQAAEPVTARRLDLDHVRAEVGQHHRRHPADRPGRRVDDADALQRLRHATTPPSTGTWAPVMYDDSSLARNRATLAISSGVPIRRIGVALMT